MDLIKKLKAEDLSFEQLKAMMGVKFNQDTLFMNWDELAKFQRVEDLMKKPALIILLHIETRDAPKAGHFILILDFKDHLEHFDSYGLTQEEELSITHEKHLTRIFSDYTKPIINNTKRLQTFRHDVNTCGRWIVARRMLAQFTLDNFLSIVKYFSVNSDDLVVALTLLLELK